MPRFRFRRSILLRRSLTPCRSGSVLALAGVGVGLFHGQAGSTALDPTSQPWHKRRLTANPSEYPISNAALSHDGRYLAFSDPTGVSFASGGNRGNTFSAIAAGIEGAACGLVPGWNAHPRYLGGGADRATSVCGNCRPSAAVLASWTDQGAEAAVSPDGTQIVFLRGSANSSKKLWLMNADGGQPRKLAGEIGDLFRSPVWSRDGKRIAYLRAGYSPGTLGVQPQIEILDTTKQDVTTEALSGSSCWLNPSAHLPMAWVDDHLAYVLNEAPPSQNDSNVWWMKI